MQFSTIFATILLAAASATAAPIVDVEVSKRAPEGLMDFFGGKDTGCAGTACLVDFHLQRGCNIVPTGCTSSGWITVFGNTKCTVKFYTDTTCTEQTNVITYGSSEILHCESQGQVTPTRSVGVTCPA